MWFQVSTAVTGALIFSTTALLLYQHVAGQLVERDFLGQTLIQMVCLVAIKLKVRDSTERAVLLSRTAVKVLLMHVCVLTLRIMLNPFSITAGDNVLMNFGILIIACVILTATFDFEWWSPHIFFEHRDVGWLTVLAFMAAIINSFLEYLTSSKQHGAPIFLVTKVSNYVEIASFVPAVWMMYGMDRGAEQFVSVDKRSKSSAESQARHFCGFLLGLYVYEDIIAGAMLEVTATFLSLLSYILHLSMIIDFTSFFFLYSSGNGEFVPPRQMSNKC